MSYRRAARRAALVLAAIIATIIRPSFCEFQRGNDWGYLTACLRACRWGWADFLVIWPEPPEVDSEDEEMALPEMEPEQVIQCSPLASEGMEV